MEITSTSPQAPTCLKMESWKPGPESFPDRIPMCPQASWLHFGTFQLCSTAPETLPTDTTGSYLGQVPSTSADFCFTWFIYFEVLRTELRALHSRHVLSSWATLITFVIPALTHPSGAYIFLKRDFYFMCMNIFPAYMLCALCAWSALGGQKKTLPSQWLELQKVVSPLWVLGIGYKFSGSVQLTTEVPALLLLDVWWLRGNMAPNES